MSSQKLADIEHFKCINIVLIRQWIFNFCKIPWK